MESPTNNTTSTQSKDGCHTPLPADIFTDNAASNDKVTDNVVNFENGLVRENLMDASLPVETTDSMCDYDMLGSVDASVHSPDNQNASSVMLPSAESNSGLLVDLNTDNDVHGTSTASLVSQSPANDIPDLFDPLQQSGGHSGGLDLASEMYVEPVTARLVQPMIPDATNTLTGVANTSNDFDLHCENPDPNTVLSLEGTNDEVVQLSKNGQEYNCLVDRQDDTMDCQQNIIIDDTQSSVMNDNQNNSAIVGEAGEKDAEVMHTDVTEHPTDHVITAHVTGPEGECRVFGDDRKESSEASIDQRIVTDQREGYDCKGDNACMSPLPEALPHVPQPQCVTTREEMSDVKEYNIGPTEEMNGSVSPSMPLQLMAVSRHIVSAVQENAFASLQQLNQPTDPDDTSTEEVEPATLPADTAMATPVVIDNEAVQGKSEATQAKKKDFEETATRDVSNIAEANKSRSAPDKAPTNNSTSVGKTLQPKPPSSTTKKSIPRKQAASSMQSPRMHSAKQGACVFLSAWQPRTITCSRNSESMIIMSPIHV